jgi:predicted Zn-dependent peptidase
LLVSAAPAAVLAQAARPAAAPAPAASVAELVRGVNIPFEQFTMPNGLRVVVHTDRKAPVVSVATWYNVGSKDEPKGKTGFAHLFEHIMLFNGTENVANLTEVLRNVGATDWNGTTWFDRTNYFETVPTPALETALYLESERMGHLLPALTQERLDNQRGVVQNEKRQNDNNPFGLVQYATLEALFPQGHPYRHSTIGSMADLDSASLEDVRTWFRENYGPNNAVLVLAGDIDARTARPLVEKYFGQIRRGPANVPAQASVPTLAAPVSAVMQDRVANTRLYRTWAVPGRTDPASVPLEVAAAVLGGLASSRLDNELVRRDQTAVSASTSLLPFQRVGMFQVVVDVKPGADVDAVSRKLDGIIADLATKGPTADEVQRAAMRAASGAVAAVEQVGGFSGKTVALAEGALYHDDPGHFRKQLDAYARVTPASVRAATQRWLTRPVYALRIDPGARPAYAESAVAQPKPAAPAAAAPAAKPPARPAPEVRTIAGLDFPAVQRTRLGNGIEVVYAQRAAVPMTLMAVEFDAGVAADPANRLGTQSLMMNLMEEGTTRLDSTQLAEAEERLGATLSAASSLDRSAVTLRAVSVNLAPSLDLLADVIRNPAFAPAEVERLRAQQLAGIAIEQTQPNGIAQRALPGLIYGPEHPYGRPFSGLGEAEAVKAVTREDLLAFHRSWIRPDNARIFIVSDRPLAELTPMLQARLGDWTAPSAPKGIKNFAGPVPEPQPRIVLIDRPQSPQSLIYAGKVLSVRGSDDLLTLNAANEVLGNNFLSRINTDIRERKGWSYGLRGFVNQIEHQTPYLIAAPVQADRTGDSVAALLENYRAFRTTQGVTAAERERTVNGNVRQLAGSFETSAQVLAALRSNALFRRPDTYWETVGPKYQSMTAADMDRAAREVIDPARFTWVIVGDAEKVRPQLDKLGLPVEVRKAGG